MSGHEAVGMDVAGLVGAAALGGVTIVDDAAAAIRASDVLIEFTLPGPSLEHLRAVVAELAKT